MIDWVCGQLKVRLCWQALEARKSAKLKRVYYDLEDQLATNPSGNVPYTPSIPLLYGLRESLGLLKAEGMDNVVARHHRCFLRAPCGSFTLPQHHAERNICMKGTLE